MKMIIIGGVLTAALLIAVVASIKADGPHWVDGGALADRPALWEPARALSEAEPGLPPGNPRRGLESADKGLI
jgi:hypothetical protein